MALTIRLQRHGRKKKPFYHIVAIDSRKARNGAFVEKLGFYDPAPDPSAVVFNEDRVKHWYSKGATLSNQVASIMKVKKVDLQREKTNVAAK